MITIGYSTRNPNPEFQEKIKKSIGLKEFTNIQKTGKPAKIAPRDITINTPDL
jgi:hypothetical protein